MMRPANFSITGPIYHPEQTLIRFRSRMVNSAFQIPMQVGFSGQVGSDGNSTEHGRPMQTAPAVSFHLRLSSEFTHPNRRERHLENGNLLNPCAAGGNAGIVAGVLCAGVLSAALRSYHLDCEIQSRKRDDQIYRPPRT
jgi:hypothetical protein